jgi:DNA-binding XRE family transcriptional regulator
MSAIRLPDLSKLHCKPVVRCECHLVQFENRETCRRCKIPFAVEEPEPTVIVKEVIPFKLVNITLDGRIALALKIVRCAQGLSQKDMARRIGKFRTHISKVERGLNQPRLRVFGEYARALGVTPYGLMLIAEAID